MNTQQRTRKLEAHRAELQRQLHNLTQFWLERAADEQHGGFYTNFDGQGQRRPMPHKYLNTQARLVWWFARLTERDPQRSKYREHLQRGLAYFDEHFWDSRHGGWKWKIHRDGTPLDDGKVVYGQSFAIYALAQAFLATRDLRWLSRATDTFDLLQIHAADTRHGGYLENLEADWTPSAPGFHAGDRKSLDTHMHLMESFTTLARATRAPVHQRKLLEVTDLICDRMIDPVTGCGLNQFDVSWRSVPAIAIRRTWNAERFGEQPAEPTETTSYGHNTELAWLMHDALRALNLSVNARAHVTRPLLEHAARLGVDWEVGGVYRDGLRDGGPVVLEKEFWQHSEAMVGFLDGFVHFGDERFLAAFECILNFAREHMITPLGEWRVLLDRAGAPLDASTGNEWKVSYHTGRALLECLDRLDHLLGQATSPERDAANCGAAGH